MKKNTIRPVEPADNLAMASVIRRVMTEFGAVGEGYSINDPEVDAIYQNYLGDRYAFFVLEQNGQVIGGGGIAPLPGGEGGTCELRKMYVLPEGRGQGWGKRLLEICLQAARKKGYDTCYLETVNRMQAAQHLYRAFGFIPLDGPLGQTGHNSCDAWYALKL
jgi:putative acetyltransferase